MLLALLPETSLASDSLPAASVTVRFSRWFSHVLPTSLIILSFFWSSRQRFRCFSGRAWPLSVCSASPCCHESFSSPFISKGSPKDHRCPLRRLSFGHSAEERTHKDSGLLFTLVFPYINNKQTDGCALA